MNSTDFLAKISHRIVEWRNSPPIRRMAAHNRKVFQLRQETSERRPVVLFELNLNRSAHIAYSYLANVLAAEYGARIVAYSPLPFDHWWKRVAFNLRRLMGREPFKVYRSFCCEEFFAIIPSRNQRDAAQKIYEKIYPKLTNNRDIEALTIDGIRVGDLIYDTYLMAMRRPTIDRSSAEFKDFLLTSLASFVFWRDYFSSHNVCAVNVSHCVYNLAMPLRIAVHLNIPTYQATVTHLYRLSKTNLFAYNDFFYFRERFASLTAEVRQAGVAEAARRIQRRFSGEIGVDMPYSTKSAYGEARHGRLLEISGRKKILIATHCFFDSPHSYGDNVFPDFYEWLDFLGQMSEATDFDWYIKTHPDYLPGTKEVIDGFIAKYPKFRLLPSDASHLQIVSEGINLALTVYGTIAFEYAVLGVPVINASKNNPHTAYDFNLHAKNVEHYRQSLENPDNLGLRIDREHVLEYYFMRYIYNTEDLFFASYERTVEKLGGYYGQFAPAVYDEWLAEWSTTKHEQILAALRQFIRSGDFRMDYTHFGREFSVESIGETA